MRRMRFHGGVCWMAGLFALALVGCSGAVPDAADPGASILLITVDGLIAADVQPFGGAHPMPNLQRLVDSGAAWPAALSAVPMTRPAVATYLTGVAPDRHNVRDDLFASLPEEIPTIAERLTAAGYRTAGFPDSSFLADRSGLWRGFEIVDRPPPVPISAGRWWPIVRPPELTGDAFSAWLDSLDEGTDWFGWVHLSLPLIAQLRQQYFTEGAEEATTLEEALQLDDPEAYAESLSEFDALVGRLLDRVEARVDAADTVILLGGTLGDQRRGTPRRLPGLGYSLAHSAVHVPVIARFPASVVVGRGADESVWAPDVTATIAALAGVQLSAQAEGRPLTEPAAERTVFSWSWALLDQLGWRRLALARNGDSELLVGDPGSADRSEDPALDALRQALDRRANPARPGLPDEIVASLTADFEIEPDPLPEQGRDFEDIEMRQKIATYLWIARSKYQINRIATVFVTATKRRWDPEAYAVQLDSGQTMVLRGMPAARASLTKAVTLRPDDPEAWHWYAHVLWRGSWRSAERILTAIQPYLANQSDALYDLACARSLDGDVEASADFLERAFLAGFRDRDHISSDPDLRNLRESEHFARVMQRFH